MRGNIGFLLCLVGFAGLGGYVDKQEGLLQSVILIFIGCLLFLWEGVSKK